MLKSTIGKSIVLAIIVSSNLTFSSRALDFGNFIFSSSRTNKVPALFPILSDIKLELVLELAEYGFCSVGRYFVFFGYRTPYKFLLSFFFASSKQYAHKSIHWCNSGDGQYICQLFLSTYLKAESFLAADESLSFVTRLNADRNKV